MATPLRRTRLAILIPLIGTGSLYCPSALAQEDASPHRGPSIRIESNESAIRDALGLPPARSAASTDVEGHAPRPSGTASTVAPARTVPGARAPTAGPRWDASALGLASRTSQPRAAGRPDASAAPTEDASDEDRIRWTLAILPPAAARSTRDASPGRAGVNAPVVGARATSRPAPSDERLPVEEAASEEPILADRAQPSQFVSPLPDVEAVESGAASLLATGTVPHPRRRNDRRPAAMIADTPMKWRRGNPWLSASLSLPPERAGTNDGALAGAARHKARPVHPRVATRTKQDPLIALLQVLDDGHFAVVYREPPENIASQPADANETRIAADVFERIAAEVERLADGPNDAATVAASIASAAGASLPRRNIVETVASPDLPVVVAEGMQPSLNVLAEPLSAAPLPPPEALGLEAVAAIEATPLHAALPRLERTDASTHADFAMPVVASAAPLVDDDRRARGAGGRFLPMHLLDSPDDEMIDPAGALPVQALLVRPSARAIDPRPIHELLPRLPAINADSQPEAASIAALRSFIDDRSAMKIAEMTEVASDGRRPTARVAAAPPEAPAEVVAFETLDFPPLFDESPRFAKLQVEAGPDVEQRVAQRDLLSFVPEHGSAAGPRGTAAARANGTVAAASRAATRTSDDAERIARFDTIAANPALDDGLRPSISFDIFDPNLAAATQSAPVEFEIQSIVRGRRDPSAPTHGDEPRLNPLDGTLVALADSRLEEMRGGFETDNGLKISFGIERAVYVNGSLVTTTSLNVADLSRLSAGQAQSMGIDRATLGLVQSGANNTFTPGQLSSGVATVVQNTLNDQKIQGITQINATVNSLDLIRRSDVQSRIQGALTDSIRR